MAISGPWPTRTPAFPSGSGRKVYCIVTWCDDMCNRHIVTWMDGRREGGKEERTHGEPELFFHILVRARRCVAVRAKKK